MIPSPGQPASSSALRRWEKVDGRRPYPSEFPVIWVAHDCYRDLAPLRKAEVEARLLAGEGDAAIADRCGMPATAVEVFHDLYFNVRPHLGDAAVIARLALPWWPSPGEPDHVGALKLFGYALGGRAVDALLHYVINPPTAGTLADGIASIGPHKALWERLLGRASALISSAGGDMTDRLLSVVALLREEGGGLVAEGVEIPVPPRSLEPAAPTGTRAEEDDEVALAEEWEIKAPREAQEEPLVEVTGEGELEEEMVFLDDDEDYDGPEWAP